MPETGTRVVDEREIEVYFVAALCCTLYLSGADDLALLLLCMASARGRGRIKVR